MSDDCRRGTARGPVFKLRGGCADDAFVPSVPPPGWRQDGPPGPESRAVAPRSATARHARRTLAGLRVRAPGGAEWRVRRRWVPRLRLPRPERRGSNLSVLNGIVSPPYWLFGTVALLAVLLVLIPLLLFGLELVAAGCLLAASVIGSLFLRQPWLVQATVAGGQMAPGGLEWEVVGWRESRALIREVAAAITAGQDPQSVGVPSPVPAPG